MQKDVLRYLGGASRRLRLRRALESAACGAIAAAMAAATVQVICWWAGRPRWWPVVFLLPLGALIGAIVGAAGRAGRRQAAMLLDARADLAERLATAAEMAEAGADDPAARCVYAQAMDAAGRARTNRVSLWRRTPATPASLGLAVGVCVVLGFLPARAADLSEAGEVLGDVAAALETLSPAEATEVAGGLRILARQAAGKAELSEALARAAGATERGRIETLRAAVAELQRALAGADDETRRQILNGIVAAVGSGKRPGGLARRARGAGGEAASNGLRPSPDAGERPAAAGGRVGVYDPLYADVLRKTRARPRPTGDGPAQPRAIDTHPGANEVRLADAWRRARGRASAALAGGQIPAEYRPIVRRFFATEQP